MSKHDGDTPPPGVFTIRPHFCTNKRFGKVQTGHVVWFGEYRAARFYTFQGDTFALATEFVTTLTEAGCD